MTLELPPLLRQPGIRVMEYLRKTDALDILPDLLKSQNWNLAELEAQQVSRFADLGRFCRTEVPWYGPLFDQAGLRDGSDLGPESLLQLPLTRKNNIRDAGDTICSASFASWQPRAKSTSGSTGTPLNYFLDRPSHSYQWAHLWRGWSQVGYQPGDIFATLSGGSLVPEKVDFKQKVYLLLSGALHLPSYHLNERVMTGYLEFLERRQVPFLYGYPSSLELFAEFITAAGGHTLPMKAVFTTSESLRPDARTTIESAFGCPILDTYGCNDGGLYSFECEQHRGFHVGMESVFVEITDDEGNRLPDGEIGHVVTTNLVIRSMPLIRYVTGDIGAIDRSSCACGRGLLRIVNLQGRERDFVLTPAGRKVHGAFFNHFDLFYSSEWLHRFQVYQPDQQTLIVRMMVHREPSQAERDQMIAELRKGLGEMDIHLDLVDKMELTRTGKFRVIISDIT